jgi:hypothetical protein
MNRKARASKIIEMVRNLYQLSNTESLYIYNYSINKLINQSNCPLT